MCSLWHGAMLCHWHTLPSCVLNCRTQRMELCGPCLLTTQHPYELLLAACLATGTVAHYTEKLEVNPFSFLNVHIYLVIYPEVIRAVVCSFFSLWSTHTNYIKLALWVLICLQYDEAFPPMVSEMIEVLHWKAAAVGLQQGQGVQHHWLSQCPLSGILLQIYNLHPSPLSYDGQYESHLEITNQNPVHRQTQSPCSPTHSCEDKTKLLLMMMDMHRYTSCSGTHIKR